MRILITGANGQLGSEISNISSKYSNLSFDFHDVDTLDLLNKQNLNEYFKQKKWQKLSDKIVKMVPFHCARPKGACEKCMKLAEEGEKYCLVSFQYSSEEMARPMMTLEINGEEVLRQYAPVDLSHDAFATGYHESGTPSNFTLDSGDVNLV